MSFVLSALHIQLRFCIGWPWNLMDFTLRKTFLVFNQLCPLSHCRSTDNTDFASDDLGISQTWPWEKPFVFRINMPFVPSTLHIQLRFCIGWPWNLMDLTLRKTFLVLNQYAVCPIAVAHTIPILHRMTLKSHGRDLEKNLFHFAFTSLQYRF